MKAVQARLERLESDGAMAVQPADQSAAGPVDDSNLITRINQLQRRTLSILQRADAAGRADVALKAIREARGNMELLARLNQISGEAESHYLRDDELWRRNHWRWTCDDTRGARRRGDYCGRRGSGRVGLTLRRNTVGYVQGEGSFTIDYGNDRASPPTRRVSANSERGRWWHPTFRRESLTPRRRTVTSVGAAGREARLCRQLVGWEEPLGSQLTH